MEYKDTANNLSYTNRNSLETITEKIPLTIEINIT